MRKPLTVLLVDDSWDDRFAHRRLLEEASSQGYRFLEAENGAAALELIRTESPDCVLLDFNLPDMPGTRLLEQVHLPIILLTGSGDERIATRAFHGGAEDYLVKEDVTPLILHQAVQGAVQRFTLDRELERRREELEVLNAELARKDQLKSRFLANVSHEIRTPIAGILGMSTFLKETPLGGEQRELVDTIDSCAHSLLTLIDDLLDLTRIEAGKLPTRRADFALRKVVDPALDAVRHLAREKGLELEVRVAPDVPEHLVGDGPRIRQVLVNLLGNALKFSHEGVVRVEVKLVQPGSDPVVVRFSVEDQGPGISPEDQKRLFEPFEQLDPQGRSRQGGSGLGLALCQQLVQIMEGTMGLESEPGRGSCFWFCLPLKVGSPPAQARRRVTSRNSYRMLLVEDNAINLRVLRMQLQRLGHEVLTATDGEEALRRVLEEPPQLIFMDCELPVLDGYEATRRIRAWESESSQTRIPIVALTAHAMKGERRRCLDAGMDAYLTKPVDSAELDETIAGLLEM